MGGINKCGARLLPTTVSACAMNFVHFCHLVKSQHCCLCSCGIYNPPLAAHLHLATLPPSCTPTLLYVCAICYITVVMREVADNPVVLASQQK